MSCSEILTTGCIDGTWHTWVQWASVCLSPTINMAFSVKILYVYNNTWLISYWPSAPHMQARANMRVRVHISEMASLSHLLSFEYKCSIYFVEMHCIIFEEGRNRNQPFYFNMIFGPAKSANQNPLWNYEIFAL